MVTMQPETAFGIDIGGTGIKGGVVDLRGGVLVGERFRLDTPQPSTTQAVAETAGKVAANFDYQGPFGVAFPGVVLHGVVKTAANVDKGWIDTSLQHAMEPELPGPVTVLNDADAAGLAEARYGAGRGRRGLVIVVTFGTGIGIALVNDGKLVPNAELGHNRFSMVRRYFDARFAHCSQLRPSRSRADAAARLSASYPSSSM